MNDLCYEVTGNAEKEEIKDKKSIKRSNCNLNKKKGLILKRKGPKSKKPGLKIVKEEKGSRNGKIRKLPNVDSDQENENDYPFDNGLKFIIF